MANLRICKDILKQNKKKNIVTRIFCQYLLCSLKTFHNFEEESI